jgi:lysophospholipase L1-like esterase
MMSRRTLLKATAGGLVFPSPALAWSYGGVSYAPALWSPTDADSPLFSISADLTTASLSSAPGANLVLIRSNTQQSYGVSYVEFKILAASSSLAVGLAAGYVITNDTIGSDANSVGYRRDYSQILLNNVGGVTSPGAYNAGDIIGMLVNFTANTVQFNLNGGAFNSTTDITSLGGILFIAASYPNTSPLSSIKINGGYGSFVYPIPAGATPWNAGFPPAGTTLNIINHGDSISLTSGVQNNYLPRLAALIQSNNKGLPKWTRCGSNGVSWNYAWAGGEPYPYTLIQDIPLRVVPAYSGTLTNWVIAFAGTNGIDPFLGNHSAATEYANFQTYITALLATGIPASNVIVCTMLPRTGITDSIRTTYNASLVSGAATYGYQLARLDLNPNIGFAGQNLTSWYQQPGGVHPVDAGQAIIASIIYGVMFP